SVVIGNHKAIGERANQQPSSALIGEGRACCSLDPACCRIAHVPLRLTAGRINHRRQELAGKMPATASRMLALPIAYGDYSVTLLSRVNEEKQTTDRYTLADLERWSEITREIDPPIRLGVFGDPVAHSLSPQMQNAALRAFEINMQYARFHIRANELRSALRFIHELDFVGINLTVPHKVVGLAQIDVADESASRCGAVNTLRLHGEKLIGANTDAEGFSRAVRSEFSIDLRDLRVMILGAGGGTGHAIAWQCALENCERLVLVNRTSAKTSAIVDRLRPFFAEPRVLGPVARLEAVGWDETAMRAQLADIDLIVNTTPLGINPSDPAPIPARLLLPHHIVFDCVYRPSKTALLRAADEAGARGANGLSMLLYQGALSFS